MPEIRHNKLYDTWVVMAIERGERPYDFGKDGFVFKVDPKDCPFCPGNEEQTPPEVDRVTKGESWQFRVVPNKFPALHPEPTALQDSKDLYEVVPGVGQHEVIIETPHHTQVLADQTNEDLAKLFALYQKRMQALWAQAGIEHVLIFKNHGDRGGASLEHPHTQLIGMPIAPKSYQQQLASAKAYYDARSSNFFTDWIAQEQALDDRVVFENEHAICLAPPAARFAGELVILPKKGTHSFLEASSKDLVGVSALLKQALEGYRTHFGDPSYNFYIHTSGLASEGEKLYHWHIELIPRLAYVAGFEWGSGYFINTMPPEKATKILRGTT